MQPWYSVQPRYSVQRPKRVAALDLASQLASAEAADQVRQTRALKGPTDPRTQVATHLSHHIFPYAKLIPRFNLSDERQAYRQNSS